MSPISRPTSKATTSLKLCLFFCQNHDFAFIFSLQNDKIHNIRNTGEIPNRSLYAVLNCSVSISSRDFEPLKPAAVISGVLLRYICNERYSQTMARFLMTQICSASVPHNRQLSTTSILLTDSRFEPARRSLTTRCRLAASPCNHELPAAVSDTVDDKEPAPVPQVMTIIHRW